LGCEQCDVDTAFLYKSKEHNVNHTFQYVVKLIDQQVELDYHLSALLVKRSSINGKMTSECVFLGRICYSSLPGNDNPAGNLQTLYTKNNASQSSNCIKKFRAI
jgi:hypothetical protein